VYRRFQEFGFPEPVAKQEMHANGNGQGITLKERTLMAAFGNMMRKMPRAD